MPQAFVTLTNFGYPV